jgi:hypothetical protein
MSTRDADPASNDVDAADKTVMGEPSTAPDSRIRDVSQRHPTHARPAVTQATHACELMRCPTATPHGWRLHQFPQPSLLERRTPATIRSSSLASPAHFRHRRDPSRGHPT